MNVSKHSRRYIGVTAIRDGEAVVVPFAETLTLSATKVAPWVRKDRRRAAAKRARVARRSSRR